MTDLEYMWEPSPWEQVLQQKKTGDSMCAVQLLTLLEGEDEVGVEAAVQMLADRQIVLDISALPPVSAEGPATQRLMREKELVEQDRIPEGLEENDPLRLYLDEVAATPAAGDPAVLAQRLVQGDRTVVEQLLNLMLGRVIEEAKRYVGKGVLLADLIQEASLGLWQSIQSYTDGDFFAHCDVWIRHYLSSAVMLQARDNGLGQKLRRAIEDYRSVDERLVSELGRNPTASEIAEALHISEQETERIAQMLESAKLLRMAKEPKEAPAEEEADQAVEDTAYFRMRQRIAELLSGLSEQDARLLTLRYGLEGGLPLKPAEVAECLRITEEEVNAREAAALASLRQEQ